MNAPPKPRIKLNSRLLPILAGLVLVMQIIAPYRGWVMLFVGLAGLGLVSFIWAWWLAYTLSLSREMRFGWAHVGDRLEERFTLVNTGIIPALWVEIIDHSTMPGYRAGRVTGVDANGLNRWYTHGTCTRRGVFTLGPTTLLTGDPFGLFTVRLHYPYSVPLTVTPPIVPLPAIEVAPGGRAGEGRARQTTFERTVSAAGIRPYLPGDSMGWIHWPTSARRGSLYVRQFDSMPSGDWWLFLDLDEQAQAGQGFNSTTEHAIILAASLADRGLRTNRAVGLVAHGSGLVWLPPRTGDGQRQEILRALALSNPGPRTLAELLAHTQPALHRQSSLIIITAAARGGWVEALLPLLRRGAVATVLLLDPVSFGGVAKTAGLQSLLANLGISHHLITRDLLDRAEARPGRRGSWQWRITPTGRAVPVRRPRNLAWKGLG